MKSIILEEYGEHSRFIQTKANIPEPGEGEVLVKVRASSINPLDAKIKKGLIGPPVASALPAVLHGDFSGEVAKLGEGVNVYELGQNVYGYIGGVLGYSGALSDYIICHVGQLALMPNKLNFEEAAVLPLAGITAWEMVMERAQVKKGQKVLILGATGGVGHLALQLCKTLGAKVFAGCGRPESAELAKQLGADEVVSYQKDLLEEYQKKSNVEFDVVLDMAGAESLANAFLFCKRGGVVATIAARSAQDLTALHVRGLTLHAVFMLLPLFNGNASPRYGKILQELNKLVDEKKLSPVLDKEKFDFNEINEAHSYWAKGLHLGKIVLINRDM